jgi:hypothetical protein
MSQVYRFTDENGQVRLFAEIAPDPVPAAGSLVPVADATGVTVDSTTYADPIKGGGAKLTTLVFPSDAGAIAIAIAGDAFPRWLFAADSTDGMYVGDGTYSPFSAGASLAVTTSGGQKILTAYAGITTGVGAQSSSWLAQVSDVSPRFTIVSGALPTVQLVTATGAQISTTRDAETHTPVTFNPGVATTATVTVALSADNVTYSTLAVVTKPVGTVFDGEIDDITVRVPAGWYLKLTVNAQAVLGLTTYY